MANVNNPHGFRLARNLPSAAGRVHSADRQGGRTWHGDLSRRSGGSTRRWLDHVGHRFDHPRHNAYFGRRARLRRGCPLATDHLVVVTPDALFEAQDNAGGAGSSPWTEGLNCNVIVSVAGTLPLKKSGHQIADSTKDVTATLDLQLIKRLALPIAENAYGPNCRVEVVINKHRMNPGVVGV